MIFGGKSCEKGAGRPLPAAARAFGFGQILPDAALPAMAAAAAF